MSDASPPLSRITRWLNKRTAPNSAPPWLIHTHTWLYVHTDGRIGHGMIGAPALILQTTGRRTGQQRTTVLAYAPDRETFVVAASNNGLDRAPAWFHNLRADPRVQLQVARQHMTGDATIVQSSDSDYPRLWALMNAINNGRYDHYQTLTRRSIPLVVITPSPRGG